MPLPPSGADIINQIRMTTVTTVNNILRRNGPKSNNIFKARQVTAAKPKGFVIPPSPSPHPPPSIVEVVYDFANCSATLSGDNIASMNVAWIPLQTAKSYKLFWRFNNSVGSGYPAVDSPIDANNPKMLSGNTNNLFQGQSNAITTNNITISMFAVPQDYNTTRITVYIYAYSDIGATNRISNFPKTMLQFVGNPRSSAINKIFLTRTSRGTNGVVTNFIDDNSPYNANSETLQTKDII